MTCLACSSASLFISELFICVSDAILRKTELFAASHLRFTYTLCYAILALAASASASRGERRGLGQGRMTVELTRPRKLKQPWERLVQVDTRK